MKKGKLLLSCVAALLTVTSCANGTKKSSSVLSSETGVSSVSEAKLSEMSSIESSMSELSSQSYSHTKMSFESYVPTQPTGAKLSQSQALALIFGAQQQDLAHAVSSTQTLQITGYDGGRKYKQSQITYATTYNDDLTVASGALEHYFTANPDTVYYDTFDQVRQLKDAIYTSMRVFKNHIFTDETEKINLLTSYGANDMVEAEKYYRGEVSCGAGLDAYETFMYASELGCQFGFTSGLTNKGDTIFIRAECASSEAQNQMVVMEMTFVYDSFTSGFLKEFVSEQRIYALDKYNQLGDDGDELSLEPTYSSLSDTQITPGERKDFEGELPVDINSAFAQRIDVTAAKSTIEVDESIALKTKVYPETALNKDVSFASEDSSIAKVNYDGIVTGVSAGTTRIIVRNSESGTVGYFTITVKEKARGDAGDDALKGDLKKALDSAFNQVFKKTNWKGSESVTSITGICINDEGSVNSKKLSALSISNFSYNVNLREATYVGNLDDLLEIIPFYDNGNANLTNNYKVNRGSFYKDTILGMTIYLKSNDTIGYVRFDLRCDSADPTEKYEFGELTNANVEEKIGAKFKANEYSRTLYYESAGFINDEE